MGRTGRARGLVGRVAELELLRRAWSDALRGQGRVVVVGGEAGIGKSTLVHAAGAEIEASGGVLLTGGCLPMGAAPPYLPIREALGSYVRSIEPARLPAVLGPRRAEIATLLPDFVARGAPAIADPEDDRSGQARLFEAVLGIVERAAEGIGRPGEGVLLVVEDLQWADTATLDLLAFLLRGLRDAAALAVLTIRTDDLDPRAPGLAFLAELERNGAERLELEPLQPGEIGELVRRREDSGGPEIVDAIARRSGGNPFFAEQLLAVALAPVEEGRGEPRNRPLPPALRDVLAARLASFPDATRRVLRVAAAARVVDDELLAAVAGVAADAAAAALREAVSRGALVEAAAFDRAGSGYTFRHQLLREAAYAELLPGERSRLHAAWARVLSVTREAGAAPRSAVPAGELAHHWVAAGDRRRALPLLLEAGIDAERQFAFTQARRHFELAAAIWLEVDEPEAMTRHDRPWLLQRAAESAMLSGDAAGAARLGRQAIEALEAGGDADAARVGELHGRLRWFLWQAGDRAGAAAAVARALELLPEAPPSPARARALAQLAGICLLDGDHRTALTAAEEALAVARAAGAGAAGALALGVLGWARAALGDVDEGVARFREAVGVAERLGGPEGIALGYVNLAALLDRVGRIEEALAAAEDGFAVVSRLGLARTYGAAHLAHAAKAQFNLGRWQEAAATLERAFRLLPTPTDKSWLRILRARLRANTGDFTGAADDLALEPDPDHRSAALAVRAELAAWQGDVEAVRATAREALARVAENRLPDPWLAWLAVIALRAEADAGRTQADDELVAAVRARLDAFAAGARGPRDAALLALCRCEQARLGGSATADAWHAAAAAWRAAGRPYPVAYATYRAGEAVLGARGPRDAAASDLREAATIARRLGAAPLLREVERLARQARIELEVAAPTTESNPAHAVGLSDREAEVLALVAAGWSNQQIGDRLFITRKTASVHVSNILGKLGVANRVEAAAVARRLGLARDELASPSG